MMSAKVIKIVTDSIIQKLEEGTLPWKRPWAGGESGMPANFISKKTYRGFNVFALALQGRGNPYWLTRNQINQQGGEIRKGEKYTPIIFWGKKENKETGKEYSFQRFYQVWNLEQVNGIDYQEPVTDPNEWSPIKSAELIAEGYHLGPKVQNGEPKAYYVPSRDVINMPKRELFENPEGYYATLFHEMGHSTGHKNRLNRDTLTDLCAFGSTNYSKEELVAEFSASMLCGISGIENGVLDNSAAYIAGWLKRLRDDRQMIVSACAQAQKGVDYILKGEEA